MRTIPYITVFPMMKFLQLERISGSRYNPARTVKYIPISAMSERKIRAIVAKPGLAWSRPWCQRVARALRDAGMEVIYTGLRQNPRNDRRSCPTRRCPCSSILSGAHMARAPRVIELLTANGKSTSSYLRAASFGMKMSPNTGGCWYLWPRYLDRYNRAGYLRIVLGERVFELRGLVLACMIS